MSYGTDIYINDRMTSMGFCLLGIDDDQNEIWTNPQRPNTRILRQPHHSYQGVVIRGNIILQRRHQDPTGICHWQDIGPPVSQIDFVNGQHLMLNTSSSLKVPHLRLVK